MPYLQNERARAQQEIQAAQAAVASLTSQVAAQQQVVAAAQARLPGARNTLANAQAALPPLVAAAAAADQRVAQLDEAIEAHAANEPDQFIERPNKPPLPNPAWRTWNQRLQQLNTSRGQAAAEASVAHGRVNDANRAIAQAQAALQAAEAEAARADATLGQLNQAFAAAQTRLASAQQEFNRLGELSNEIEREPMDRPALEQAAADLSKRTLDLEDAWAAARAASRAADAALAALLSRRGQLTAAIAEINSQLIPANAEVTAADAAVADLAQQIEDHITGGP
jgi:chromosome segregation ATPase